MVLSSSKCQQILEVYQKMTIQKKFKIQLIALLNVLLFIIILNDNNLIIILSKIICLNLKITKINIFSSIFYL